MSREMDIRYIENRLSNIIEKHRDEIIEMIEEEMFHADFVSDMLGEIQNDVFHLITRTYHATDDLAPDRTMWELYFNLLDQANDLGQTSFIFEYKDEFYISEWSKGKWTDPRKIARLA